MYPSSLKMHMAIHANTRFLFTHLDKEHLSYTLFLRDITLDDMVSQYSVLFLLKKEIPTHKSHAKRIRSPPTHFLNSVQNFKYLIPPPPDFCQRILSVQIKHMISNINWEKAECWSDALLQCANAPGMVLALPH